MTHHSDRTRLRSRVGVRVKFRAGARTRGMVSIRIRIRVRLWLTLTVTVGDSARQPRKRNLEGRRGHYHGHCLRTQCALFTDRRCGRCVSTLCMDSGYGYCVWALCTDTCVAETYTEALARLYYSPNPTGNCDTVVYEHGPAESTV